MTRIENTAPALGDGAWVRMDEFADEDMWRFVSTRVISLRQNKRIPLYWRIRRHILGLRDYL